MDRQPYKNNVCILEATFYLRRWPDAAQSPEGPPDVKKITMAYRRFIKHKVGKFGRAVHFTDFQRDINCDALPESVAAFSD